MSPHANTAVTPYASPAGVALRERGRPLTITSRVLRRWALPRPDDAGDKEERGRVLVVGGAPGMPGAVILAATAALRAGAGKLQVATCATIQQHVAVALPEALVIGLRETASGGIDPAAADELLEHANHAQALLVGPGVMDEEAICQLLHSMIPRLDTPTLILDAGALSIVNGAPHTLQPLRGNVVLTPHAGEMAAMLGIEKAAVTEKAPTVARQAAHDWQAVVALKGAATIIATPDGELYQNRSGNVGLATSGSGDTLSGIIAGFAARGATPAQAAAWGVHLHGQAGDRLASRIGGLGFLARELLAEIPPLLAALA